MTTIATDGKSMAADGLVTSDGTVFGFNCVKIVKLADGRIAAACGSAYNFAPFTAWLESGGDPPELTDGFEGLVLSADGSCRSYDAKCRSIVEELPATSGSGRQLAMGAMLAGASPKEAVEIAAQRCQSTGGKVISIALD